jgi:hypothetical protein
MQSCGMSCLSLVAPQFNYNNNVVLFLILYCFLQYMITNHTTLLFDRQFKRLCNVLPLKIFVYCAKDSTDV